MPHTLLIVLKNIKDCIMKIGIIEIFAPIIPKLNNPKIIEKDLKFFVGKYLLGSHNISNEEHELTNNRELLAFVVKSTKL